MCIVDLEQEIKEMKLEFKKLVVSIQQSKNISLTGLKEFLSFIPKSVRLKLVQKTMSEIFDAKSLQELFYYLANYWDYLNSGLLESIIQEFGSDEDRKSMNAYLKDLDHFRARVKAEDYIQTSHAKRVDCDDFFYKQIILKMEEEGWKSKTLQDVENFRLELSKQCHFLPYLTQIHVTPGSVALVVTIPCWIEIDIVKLDPVFLIKNGAHQVYKNVPNFELEDEEVSVIISL